MEQKFRVRNSQKSRYTLQASPLFRKFRKILGNGIHRRKNDGFKFYYNTLRTFALIASAHPYCARKFTPRHR